MKAPGPGAAAFTPAVAPVSRATILLPLAHTHTHVVTYTYTHAHARASLYATFSSPKSARPMLSRSDGVVCGCYIITLSLPSPYHCMTHHRDGVFFSRGRKPSCQPQARIAQKRYRSGGTVSRTIRTLGTPWVTLLLTLFT